jgi:MtN3 and saliva related transmembrane protein
VEPSPLVTAIGLAAAVLTTVSFLPQVLKVWRSRRADGISLGMYSIFCTGIVLWLAYGLLTDDLPIIAANVVTLALAGSVLVLAVRYRRR